MIWQYGNSYAPLPRLGFGAAIENDRWFRIALAVGLSTQGFRVQVELSVLKLWVHWRRF